MNSATRTAWLLFAVGVMLPQGYPAESQDRPVALESSVRDQVRASIERGLEYLRGTQNERGHWNASARSTGLALRAFADSHRAYVPEDGSFIRGPIQYLTSLAESVGTFVPRETGHVQDVAYLRIGLARYTDYTDAPWLDADGVNYLMLGLVSNDQFQEPANVVDLAFILQALESVTAEDALAARSVALRSLSQLQDSGDSWGFRMETGTREVTEDATAMGALALVLAGVEPSDVRLTKAVEWLEDAYDLERSVDSDRFFHYAYGLSNVMHRLDRYELQTADGPHLWRSELAKALNRSQQNDGRWANVDSGSDEDPVLETVLAVHALELIYNDPGR